MARICVVAEGQTEVGFVNRVLKPFFEPRGISITARAVETGRERKKGLIYRGGVISYGQVNKDLSLWLKQEKKNPDVVFSTMVDLYRLPKDFPGYEQASGMADPYQKVETLEDAFCDEISDRRFIPYIQLHEYEALLFADPSRFDCEYIEEIKAIDALVKIADDPKFSTPEHIDDNPESAPSKRIIKHLPAYKDNKPRVGVLVAEKIGLENIRKKCKHFDRWLVKLEKRCSEIDGG